MFRITNKDRDELTDLLRVQIAHFRSLSKGRKLTGRDRIIMNKALYLEYRLSKLKKA